MGNTDKTINGSLLNDKIDKYSLYRPLTQKGNPPFPFLKLTIPVPPFYSNSFPGIQNFSVVEWRVTRPGHYLGFRLPIHS